MTHESPTTQRNIRDTIVDRRRERIAGEGYSFGLKLPASRDLPIVPFNRKPLLICEIKRRSPSRGAISASLDPVEQARLYAAAGVQSVSILTEEDHFGGSLPDLRAVKQAFPDLSILRKDFLVDEEDVRTAWLAGADAVLLIASMLDQNLLGSMLRTAESLGMMVLVEVHSSQEIEKVRPLKPQLLGINCRNLEDFSIDRLLPLGLRHLIDWNCEVVFESGIFTGADARFAGEHNFQGLLVGEAVVKNPAVIPELMAGLHDARPGSSFWKTVANKLTQRRTAKTSRPLVKICGITTEEDGRRAIKLGADFLGFVFAQSPRRATESVVRALSDVTVPRIAVVVNEIPVDLQSLLADGLIDAIQMSGDETIDFCTAQTVPWYKTVRVSSVDGLKELENWRSPRILLDAWSPTSFGGTGKLLARVVVLSAKKTVALWMAGGIGPDNIADIVDGYQPELVDLSSRLESEPGHKDPALMQRFFDELQRATSN